MCLLLKHHSTPNLHKKHQISTIYAFLLLSSLLMIGSGPEAMIQLL